MKNQDKDKTEKSEWDDQGMERMEKSSRQETKEGRSKPKTHEQGIRSSLGKLKERILLGDVQEYKEKEIQVTRQVEEVGQVIEVGAVVEEN